MLLTVIWNTFITSLFLFAIITEVNSTEHLSINLVGTSLAITGLVAYSSVKVRETYFHYYCQTKECCSDSWFVSLDSSSNNLILPSTILKAVNNHDSTKNTPLIVNIQTEDEGKFRVLTDKLAKKIYRNGEKSIFYHYFDQLPSDLPIWQFRNWIRYNVTECSRTLFVFSPKINRKYVYNNINDYLKGESSKHISYGRSIFVTSSKKNENEIQENYGIKLSNILIQDNNE